LLVSNLLFIELITKASALTRSVAHRENALRFAPGGAFVSVESTKDLGIEERLESAIAELQTVQEVLTTEEVDGQVLRDFRDALNRVRNTAWAAQKYVESNMFDEGQAGMTSFLAGERIRTAFQMCSSVKEDLRNETVEFQKGQLAELQTAVAGLQKQLKKRLS
jgi:hypothetical protein